MAQERCVLALPSCGERVSNVYVWDLTHRCVQVPLSVKNTSSLVCFSRHLDPTVAIVTAVELDTISHKFVSITGIPAPPVLVRRYSAHAMACTRTRLS